MAPPYTLLSGATGFLGMHILKQLLETGHRVRVISRSQEKGKVLQEQFEAHASSIDIVEIQDQLAPNAYDEAAKGVEAVIHTASPFIHAENVEEELLKPAIAMATNMLKAAAKAGTVKRVALTSSFAAMINFAQGGPFADIDYTSDMWNPLTREEAKGPMLGYLASKKLAEQAAWDFIEKEKPGFDLVTLNPTLIVGEPLQHVASMDKLNTSCADIYQLLDCKELPKMYFPMVVSVHDTALAHVRAIDVPAAGGKRFIIHSEGWSAQLVVDAIREKYPELRDRVMVGNTGKSDLPKPISKLDTTPAQEILGIKFAGWYECIMEQTIPALLALEKKLKK